MAVGAITVSKQGVLGNMKYAIVSVVGPSSYTGSGGDALDLNAVTGFSTIYSVSPCYGGGASSKTTAPTVNAALWLYDIQSKKLQAFGTAANALGLTEATGTTNFSNTTVTLFVLGS